MEINDKHNLHLICKRSISVVPECMKLNNFWRQAPTPILSLLITSFLIPPSHRASALCLLLDLFGSILSIHFSSHSLYLPKSFCLIVCVVSLSIFITTFTEAFPASAVLSYALCVFTSHHLNVSMLGVTNYRSLYTNFLT